SMGNRIAMYTGNALKIGLFGANCSSGRSATKVPERWSASWPDCLKLAKLADDAGLDFMLPIARWKGYGGDTDFHGCSLETITWAVGLLSATKRMTVFGTVHAPLFHPLIIMVERLRELKPERGRIGLMEIDPRHADYLPVNQYNVLRENLPDADIVFTQGFLHELLSIHSPQELDCLRTARLLCHNAMTAMV